MKQEQKALVITVALSILAIFAAGGIVGYATITKSSGQIINDAVCIDSDQGTYAGTSGYVRVTDMGGTRDYPDKCKSDRQIYEGICKSGTYVTVLQHCREGGRCVADSEGKSYCSWD